MSTNEKIEELKPCPCGGIPVHDIYETYSTDSSFWMIQCPKCLVMLMTGQELTAKDVATWNALSTPQPDSSDGWIAVEGMNKSAISFWITYCDGAMRALLWNPRGYWEHPFPIGAIVAKHEEPSFIHPLPPEPRQTPAQGSEVRG